MTDPTITPESPSPKSCGGCRHYKAGRCAYPVPAWINLGIALASGGQFLDYNRDLSVGIAPDFGSRCPTFEPREEAANA